eukprot:11388520-Alexandrium_andersonii.AAC.1
MRSCRDSCHTALPPGGGIPLSFRLELSEMPRVDDKLPSEQGLNWQEYVRFGRDDFTTYFDTLWQDGWIS